MLAAAAAAATVTGAVLAVRTADALSATFFGFVDV